MQLTAVITVSESSQVGEARRSVIARAAGCGFDEVKTGKAAIVVTELANNLLKHARGGRILVQVLPSGDGKVLEILALDQGPGMSNLSQCSSDGFTTGSTPGTGLGAIQRNSDHIDVFSSSGKGTVLLTQFRASPPEYRAASPLFEVGSIGVPYPGEQVSGDGWACELKDGYAIMLADGLGHGTLAHEAARAAEHAFYAASTSSPASIMQLLHGALRSTRGGAVSIARVDPAGKKIHYCGVGNTMAAIASPRGIRRTLSHNGTVGIQARKIQELTYDWDSSSALILHSDGLSSGWDMKDYPGLLNRHPSVIAAVLWRDFHRTTDDSTVVVVKEGPQAQTA